MQGISPDSPTITEQQAVIVVVTQIWKRKQHIKLVGFQGISWIAYQYVKSVYMSQFTFIRSSNLSFTQNLQQVCLEMTISLVDFS